MVVYAKIKKSSTSEIWIKESDFLGPEFIDVRLYFLPEGKTSWLPTKKGVVVSKSTLTDLLKSVKALVDKDEEGITGILNESENKRIQIGKCSFLEKPYFEIRQYYRQNVSDNWNPGKGITFSDRQIGYVIDAFELVVEQAE